MKMKLHNWAGSEYKIPEIGNIEIEFCNDNGDIVGRCCVYSNGTIQILGDSFSGTDELALVDCINKRVGKSTSLETLQLTKEN